MKKITSRALLAAALAAALLLGLLVFCGEYFVNAKDWVTFPGSPHVYTGVNPDCGRIYDRDGTLLLNTNDGRVYSADETVRVATMHLLGDRDGYISAPLLKAYASKMIGFDVVNGLYTDEAGSVAARLTISAKIQAAAQQALGSYPGTIGVYNYKTGELLCAVTSPSYDPDNVPDVAGDTTGRFDGVYVNRFFDAAYTPGSIFKLATAAAALETIPDVQSRTFTCTGKTIIGGQEIVCSGVHGTLDLSGALAHSCNIAFGELAAELGAETLQTYAEKFGLNESYVCDGYVSDEGHFDLTDADDGDVAWAGIGQYTTQVSALAFLRYLGAIANGGKAAEPYLMQRVRKGDEITYEAGTEFSAPMLEPATAETLTKLMRNDVQTVYGDWQFGGLSVCAKSGTAEREGKTANAMFAGFVLDDACPVAFVVIAEGGGAGSTVAGPMAAKVLQAVREVLSAE